MRTGMTTVLPILDTMVRRSFIKVLTEKHFNKSWRFRMQKNNDQQRVPGVCGKKDSQFKNREKCT